MASRTATHCLMRSEPANTHTVGIPLERCHHIPGLKLTTPVLLSPEIALSERFRTKVLYDQAFRDHLVLVAIDELHVVRDWGKHWRSSYSRLALLRDLIDRPVPWLGCSATLDRVTL